MDAAPSGWSTLRAPLWTVPGPVLFVAVGLAYAVGSQLAIALIEASGLDGVFFIPAGLTVAVLVRTPRRQWWLVVTAAALAELLSDLASGYPIGEAAGFALANATEPLVGALLVARVSTSFDLARRRDTVAFLAGAVVAAPIVGAGIGAAVGASLGDADFWPVWWQWAVGDALGVVLVGSALLALGSSPDRRTLRSAAGGALLIGSAAVAVLAVGLTDLPVLFSVMIAVTIAGVVFGSRAVAAIGLVSGMGVAVALLFDDGPVIDGIANSTALMLIKAQLCLYAGAGLLVAAEAFEAQRAARAAAESQARADLLELVRANQIRFESTFDNAGVGMAHIAPDGRFMMVNERLCEILAYTRDELLATTYHAVTDPADRAHNATAAAALLDGEPRNVTIEKQSVRKDGSSIWTTATVSLVRNDDGEPDYFIAVVDDISTRKAAEDALRERELAERRAREHAELRADIVNQLEEVDTLAARVSRLTRALVPRFADYAVVDGVQPALAVAHADPEVEAQVVARAAAAADVDGADVARRCPRSHMSLPLALGGEVQGTLSLGISDPDRPTFSATDWAFLRELADRCGVVLTAAWLREEEHRISLRLQRALLPDHVVQHPDVEIGARYESASEVLEIGGDWYDVIHRSDGTIVVAVGDVVGHGLDAAATMGRLRVAFAASTSRTGSPAQLLADLDAFAQGPGEADFTTVSCALLDPTTGELRYSSAGHPPILLVAADGSRRWLDGARSLPLCTAPDTRRPEESIHLADGDLVVLFSDGLVERRTESIDVGMERLARVTQAVDTVSVDELCRRVVATMTEGSPPGDDLIMVALRFHAASTAALRRVIPARPAELAPLRATVRAWLDRRGIEQDGQFGVLQTLSEACSNAVEHAYADTAPGHVEVEISEEHNGCLRVRVRDHGRWRPPRPDADDGTRGWGTDVMRKLSRRFDRHTGPDGTVVTLSVPVSEPAAPTR